MNKYLRQFDTHQDYLDFLESEDYLEPNVSYCSDQNEVHYNPYVHDYSKDYFTTKALENGSISFTIPAYFGTSYITSMSYSVDNGETWTTINNTDDREQELTINVNVNNGDKILWKGDANCLAYNDGDGWFPNSHFSSTSNYEVCGNVMSLLDGDNFKESDSFNYNNTFSGLFNSSTKLIHSKNLILPVMTLTYQCYGSMFYNCTSLVDAPVLPATTLANWCYYYMFYGCTSLIVAPELPATTLKSNCYLSMFYNCTSLITAPELPTTSVTDNYSGSCYASMFENCTSLIEAPTLPITHFNNDSTARGNCSQYNRMFYGCSNLNYIRCYLVKSVNNCADDLLTGVAGTGVYVTTNITYSSQPVTIPQGWTIVYYDEPNNKYYLDYSKTQECDDHGNPIT